MRRKIVGSSLLGLILCASLIVLGGFRSGNERRSGGALPPAAERTVDYRSDVRPIFASRCVSCHGPEKSRGDLRLDVRGWALEGGSSGAVILPGRSAESLLIRLVGGLEEQKMPPEGPPLTAAEVGLLRAWIDRGAVWPEETSRAPNPGKAH